jgi:amino acid transporter
MQKSEQVGVGAELSRELTLFHITMMGLGMMIGAGVFIGIGNAIRIAGPGGLMLTFALNGLIAMFTAMSYAELSSAIPRAGGAYNFARIGFGRGPAFLGGWMEWFASSVAGSLYAYTLAIYTLRCLVEWGVMGAVNARDVVGAILREAREHDLLVIGCTRVPLLRRLRSLPIPERVARNCPKPLVMVNVPEYIQGWLNRWV